MNLLVLTGVLFAAGLVTGVTGFGAGLVSMGALALLMPVAQATVIVAVIAFFSSLLNLWTVRREVVWRETWPLLVTALPANILGVYLLKRLDNAILGWAVGVAILMGCGAMLWSPQKCKLKRVWPWGYLAGLVGGVFGGALSTGGPPVVLYTLLRGWDKGQAKGLLASYFTLTGLWRLLLLAAAGVATPQTLGQGLLALIPALGASYVGVWLFQRMSTPFFRYVTMAVLAGLALQLVLAR